MNESKFYQSQRNKYFELYKTAPTEEAKDECYRIMFWYATELSISENELFLEKLQLFHANKEIDIQTTYIECLERV